MAWKDCLKELEKNLTDVPYENEEQKEISQKQVINSDVSNFVRLNEAEIRKILESQVYFTKNSRKLQTKIEINRITHSDVYMYGLETWVQKRQLFDQFKKYKFGRIDDSSFGNMPDAWNIQIRNEENIKPFTDHVENVKLKHSEYIQPCSFCPSSTPAACSICEGNKQLVYYQNCKISWHSYKDEYMTEPHLIPSNKIKLAYGKLVFQQQNKKIDPIKYDKEEQITCASEKYHKQHRRSSQNEKVLLQKQFLKKIDVFTIHYTYKNKSKKIFIYGDNREVHTPYSFTSTSIVSCFLPCILL